MKLVKLMFGMCLVALTLSISLHQHLQGVDLTDFSEAEQTEFTADYTSCKQTKCTDVLESSFEDTCDANDNACQLDTIVGFFDDLEYCFQSCVNVTWYKITVSMACSAATCDGVWDDTCRHSCYSEVSAKGDDYWANNLTSQVPIDEVTLNDKDHD